MDAAELKLLKQYMHIDHDDDDDVIKRLFEDSKRYLARGGAVGTGSQDTWYAAVAMTLEKYDGTPLPDCVQKIINQLKLQDPAF
jgi:uncharacterized phage protein (predicted DNA packaging)